VKWACGSRQYSIGESALDQFEEMIFLVDEDLDLEPV
jgi:hypothetical protein